MSTRIDRISEEVMKALAEAMRSVKRRLHRRSLYIHIPGI